MTTKQRGRPRSFDRDAALQRAVLVFWEHGYENTSVADLTRALGIAAPSLYAAFGDKRALFAEVVEAYAAGYGSYGGAAFDQEPTARAAFARMLREAAEVFTVPGRPHGCLMITAAVNCGTPEVRDALRERRNANLALFEERLRRGVAEGDLAPGNDLCALARFYGAVLQGMSQQSRDGAELADLEAIAETAMKAWPQ
ncbi:TetR/AcrR family transcriptional regulator [Streptomyces sp. NPDC001941]|uniref:TetR/AcrR family transcriptional regulator n=1 Tax=Streptomyces sp. NPDC001941 TaxID=3154659 RepID=UPI003326186D